MTSLIAPVWQEMYIAALRNGDLPASAAAMVGTTQKQVDFWRTQCVDFDDAISQILEERIDALENKAYNLALNGTLKTIYAKDGARLGEETVEHKDLLMFMLKASRDKFNDKLITQSKVDHNITISITSFAQNPDNEREVIEGEFTTPETSDSSAHDATQQQRPSAVREFLEAYT